MASAVVFLMGLASFGVLAWAARKAVSLERALDAGDIVVFGVLAAFGSFCVWVAWQLFRDRPQPQGSAAAASPASRLPGSRPKRVTISNACSAAGVLLLMLSVLLPAHWYPVVLLFLGLAFLAVAHALTPCEERLEKLRKARASLRQL
jgi:hypothetical protein